VLFAFIFKLKKMYQDYLMSETSKFARLLAKLIGLKVDGDYEEYTKQFDIILHDEYHIELGLLLDLTKEAFKAHVLNAGYSPEKINALSQMLYVFAEPFTYSDDTQLILKKVLILFDILGEKGHFDSFENIEKRNAIYRYFIKADERS